MRYALTLLVCVSCFLGGRYSSPSEGLFFASQATWSFIILMGVLIAYDRRPIIFGVALGGFIASLEILAIIVNLTASYWYFGIINFAYTHYEYIMITINVVEFSALAYGAFKYNRHVASLFASSLHSRDSSARSSKVGR